MSMDKEDVTVKIYNNELSLKGDKESIQKLAQYVDDKIQDVEATTKLNSTTKVVIYAALQIASELFQQEAENVNIEDKYNKKASRMVKTLQEALK
jgi:cell division protein ZapA (FtsZ GTPase activity inhibitor)